MTVVALIRRLRDEYTARPGLRLSEAAVERLCTVGALTAASALRALVSAGFLEALDDGTYQRVSVPQGDTAARAAQDPPESPWRRILCLVEFDDGPDLRLTAASYSALAYATALGVAHRAHVTALLLPFRVPESAEDARALLGERSAYLRRQAVVRALPDLLDVRVAGDADGDAALAAAQDIGADLIVIGRPEGGAPHSVRLREVVRDAPCHVLLIHPSGQAAVA